ncbi:MAG: hypothetical protein HQM08_09860 [Candidatus Riflebacteria bacterium]|nr:hypothetical protein [Candidatus Riflebacteria bacterium]
MSCRPRVLSDTKKTCFGYFPTDSLGLTKAEADWTGGPGFLLMTALSWLLAARLTFLSAHNQ